MIDERMDDVRGVVIGGEYVGWQVIYAGRLQSGKEYAHTAEQAEADARARIAALQAECCGHPCYLYEDNARWTIRLWP